MDNRYEAPGGKLTGEDEMHILEARRKRRADDTPGALLYEKDERGLMDKYLTVAAGSPTRALRLAVRHILDSENGVPASAQERRDASSVLEELRGIMSEPPEAGDFYEGVLVDQYMAIGEFYSAEFATRLRAVIEPGPDEDF